MKYGAGNMVNRSWTNKIRALAEAEQLAANEEAQAMWRAQRMVLRRNRLAAMRLVLAFSVVVAAVVMWYMSVPVQAGLYPGKVIGGTYYSPDDGFRYPVMWVKAHPFERQPPVLHQFTLQDERGTTVAAARRGTAVVLDVERGPLARWVQGWITLHPATGQETTACRALIQVGRSEERVLDIGVLHILGKEEPPAAVGPAFSTRILFPELSASISTSVEIVASATPEPAEITSVTVGGLSGMIPTSVEVFELAPLGQADRTPGGAHTIIRVETSELTPFGTGTSVRVTELPAGVILEETLRLVGWQACRLPLELAVGDRTQLAVELVPWASVLAQEFFLYVPVEVAYRMGGQQAVTRLTAHDSRWGRPSGVFQMTVRTRAPALP